MLTMTPEILPLYHEHVSELIATHQTLLEIYEFEHAIIPSGELKYVFQDDMSYPFKTNAYFKWFLPLTNHPNCYIDIPQSGKPVLIYYLPKDYWHAVPEMPDSELFHQFDIRIIYQPGEAQALLPKPSKRIAWLGEVPTNFDAGRNIKILPEPLLSELHWQRAYKSEYERECLYQASLLGANAHQVARQGFYAGLSELQIHNAYLHALACKESDLPYGNIVALNEHAAVLHFTEMQDHVLPKSELRSFLIDAGAGFHGYASDITRTYSYHDDAFAEMISFMSQKQLEIIDAIRIGDSYVDLHLLAHRKIAETLEHFNLIKISASAAVETHITSTFLPHGLGHHLGLHVHDAGGHQDTVTGGIKKPPHAHSFLRNTRDIEIGNYLTIEPGLYFIPQLLDSLKQGEFSDSLNWPEIEKFLPFGGIRIEDNVFISEAGVENFTRQAFEAT